MRPSLRMTSQISGTSGARRLDASKEGLDALPTLEAAEVVEPAAGVGFGDEAGPRVIEAKVVGGAVGMTVMLDWLPMQVHLVGVSRKDQPARVLCNQSENRTSTPLQQRRAPQN